MRRGSKGEMSLSGGGGESGVDAEKKAASSR